MANAKIEPEAHPSEGLNIYQILDRISNEAGALAPIEKGGVPFPFRGVDSTVAHLSPFLRKYGVVVVPAILDRETTTAPSGSKVLARTTLITRFTFYAPDGSFIEAHTAGEATDFADRSTAQAQSVAFRIALLQTFALPTQTKEPEETGVEGESQTYQQPGKAQETPEAIEQNKVKNGRAAVKKLAGEKNIDYLEFAVENKLEAGWADTVAGLTKLYKLLDAAKPVPRTP